MVMTTTTPMTGTAASGASTAPFRTRHVAALLVQEQSAFAGVQAARIDDSAGFPPRGTAPV